MRVQIDFLQQAQIRMIAIQHRRDLIQMLASIDIPIDDVNRVGRRGFSCNEIAGENAIEIARRIRDQQGQEKDSWYQTTILLEPTAIAASSAN